MNDFVIKKPAEPFKVTCWKCKKVIDILILHNSGSRVFIPFPPSCEDYGKKCDMAAPRDLGTMATNH
jgi:hypothetical protein